MTWLLCLYHVSLYCGYDKGVLVFIKIYVVNSTYLNVTTNHVVCLSSYVIRNTQKLERFFTAPVQLVHFIIQIVQHVFCFSPGFNTVDAQNYLRSFGVEADEKDCTAVKNVSCL